MKKLYNTKNAMPDDMIDGFVQAYPNIVKKGKNNRIVLRTKQKDPEKVSLIIGNGSGHEPIAMGFVGEGILDANIIGDVFTAPSSDLILEGIKESYSKSGTILLISRHEGDVINGKAACLDAQDEGMDVRPLLMYDDISSAPKGREEDRRGAAGTIFIYKILGAAAEDNMTIDELMMLGERVRSNTRTLGVAINSGISPITNEEMFSLPKDEVFIGMGVHGEPGVARRKLGTVNDLVSFMMDRILEDKEIKPENNVIVLINGMGGTTLMELYSVFNEVSIYLKNKKKILHVVAIDYGIKKNILRYFSDFNCKVTIVSCKTAAKDILKLKPNGIFLSNGPGDPAATGKYAIPTIQELIKKKLPLFGICLGHQILALALGAKTEKMKLGHRGANHPVKNLIEGNVEITSQNHGFEVVKKGMPKNIRVTHQSLFDNSIEGIELKNKPVFSVQYHPESNPGPQDSVYLFDKFVMSMKKNAKKKRY